ncbi:MAG: hypothetical protein C4320_06335, partial [Armatimonadota bacterium]
TILLGPEEAYAIGNVTITDPDVTAGAADLRIRWREGVRGGTATRLRARIGAIQITAARAEITPALWTLFDAEGTACRGTPPFLSARSRRVEIIPGQRGSLRNVQLRVLGVGTPVLPVPFGFSLDERSEGVKLPSLTYRREQGLGVSFGAARLPDQSSQIVANYAAFPSSKPTYGVVYSRTSLPPTDGQGRFQPVSDLDERFFYSYFGSIYAGEPESEVNYLRRKRSNLGVESLFNIAATGRRNDDILYSKALAGVFETGGPLGSGGYQLQLRPQIFREGRGAFRPRGVVSADYAQPLLNRGRTTVIGRLDGYLTASRGVFGFGGGEVGVAYRASPNIILGASAFAFAEVGRPSYSLDPLAQTRGGSLRVDINTAPTKISLLARYDSSLRRFDREYRISQVVGCLEPVVIYREFPRSYQIGLRFRLNDLAGLVSRRDPKRPKPRDPFAR